MAPRHVLPESPALRYSQTAIRSGPNCLNEGRSSQATLMNNSDGLNVEKHCGSEAGKQTAASLRVRYGRAGKGTSLAASSHSLHSPSCFLYWLYRAALRTHPPLLGYEPHSAEWKGSMAWYSEHVMRVWLQTGCSAPISAQDTNVKEYE